MQCHSEALVQTRALLLGGSLRISRSSARFGRRSPCFVGWGGVNYKICGLNDPVLNETPIERLHVSVACAE
jgi:hypothetical protein